MRCWTVTGRHFHVLAIAPASLTAAQVAESVEPGDSGPAGKLAIIGLGQSTMRIVTPGG